MPIQDEFWGLQNILNPIFNGYQPPKDTLDPWSAVNSIYTPEHIASDRLTGLIDSMPIRHEPGMLQKIVASVAGLQGPSAAPQQDQILYGDYNRQLANWRERLNPAVQAASFERAQNINERTLANQLLTQERGFRSLERQIDRDKTLERQGDTRLNQAQQRIAQAEERIRIAEAVAKGGTIDWGSNQIVYKDGTTAPIKADLFTTQERMALQQQYALARIEAQGENRPGNRDRVRTEVIDDPDNPGKKILVTINLDTNEVKRAKLVSENTGAKTDVTPVTRTPETQLNKDRVITARALQAKVQDPDGKYVIIRNGRFEGITKPGLVFGPNIEQYKRLYLRIYGTEPTDIPQTPQVATPQGRIRVRRVNPQTGQVEIGSIPASQLEQALKANPPYEVIK